MATDVLEIANKAFVLLGVKTVISLIENKKSIKTFNAIYPTTRDAVFRAHPWNSISARFNIAPNVTKPLFEWDNQFDFPSKCIRVVSLLDVLNDEWSVEGQKILANASTIQAKCVIKNEDVTKYDALLVDTLAARLAADLAHPLVDDTALTTAMWDMYKLKIQEARSIDAQEHGDTELEEGDDSWIQAIER